MNILKTTFLLTMLTLLFVFIGSAVGGHGGAVAAFGLAALMNFGAYWFSDKLVLMMMGARELSREESPELFEIIERLTQKASMPMPKVYLAPQQGPNAFATGRSPHHAAVCVTEGILRVVDDEELEGVLAHELSHVRHRDTLISSIAATLAGAIMTLARWAQWGLLLSPQDRRRDDRGGGLGLLLVAFLAPFAALLVQFAISRSREFAADRGGALLSNKPMALANALRKLDSFPKGALSSSPHAAHLFIVNPLKGGGILSLFSTHPPMAERVKRLEAMERDRS
ncbi:MAG: zinc metalloprotease HtpX [Candidatus Omnitrophica bacterium]|nr:zinc metalloprotease HtpX [Candidatus Omnitrophota bacterium]